MALDKAIDTATQIAAGLQAAHEKGVIHRDMKSANIMVTDKGVVKIMEFGLAKLANRSKMTQLGTTLGTAAYMSPEQARGEEADNRSDIWSLGVVLYEMISGQLPFKGDYEQAVIYSILNEDPEPLTALRTGIPIALDGIIAKALAKDPATRYQHVHRQGVATPISAPAQYYWDPRMAPDGQLMAVTVTQVDSFVISSPKTFLAGKYLTPGAKHTTYDVTNDGKRFLMLRGDSQQQTNLDHPRIRCYDRRELDVCALKRDCHEDHGEE